MAPSTSPNITTDIGKNLLTDRQSGSDPRRRPLLRVALVFSLWASLTLPAPAAGGPDLDKSTTLLIKQFSEPGGEEEIFLSPLGIKTKSLRKAVCAVFLPPYKEAVMYNEHSKRIYYCKLEDFKSPYSTSMALLHAVTFSEAKLAALRPTKYLGLSAGVFGFTHDFEALQRFKMAHKDIAIMAPKTVQCVQSTRLKVDPAAVHFLDRFYGFPYTDGLPLDFSYVNFRGEPHHYMYTSEVSAASFKPTTYAIPRGYTRVKDIQELVLDDSAQESIEMMIGK